MSPSIQPLPAEQQCTLAVPVSVVLEPCTYPSQPGKLGIRVHYSEVNVTLLIADFEEDVRSIDLAGSILA